MVNKSALTAELIRRQAEKALEASKPVFDFKEYTFSAQYDFFRGEGPRFRTAVCSRRAGKTVGIAADALDDLQTHDNITILYITLSSKNARNIIWDDVLKIVNNYEMDVKVDNQRLVIKHNKTNSKFIIQGAKDRTEIEKYRGWKLFKCYIDECQSFRAYIEDLVNDIITPALRDLKGTLYLTGTPGPIPAGYFHKASTSNFWNNHHWTAFDNPHMHDPANGNDLNQTLAEERQMKEIDESDPGYQRETYGLWIEDLDSLVYKFDKTKNVYTTPPNKDDLIYIFGIDIGFNDADAIAVLGYHTKEKRVYLVEEKLVRKQDITSLVNQIKDLKAIYDPVKMVMDAGALGKKIQEEIVIRHGLNLEAAEKTRKVEFIELLNDDLRQGKFYAIPNSEFAEDCMLLQWDRESRIKNPEKPKVSDVYHSDITDAVLYGWRACSHYASEPDPNPPKLGTNEYMLQMEQKEAERLQERKENPDDFALMEAFEDDWEGFDDW